MDKLKEKSQRALNKVISIIFYLRKKIAISFRCIEFCRTHSEVVDDCQKDENHFLRGKASDNPIKEI